MYEISATGFNFLSMSKTKEKFTSRKIQTFSFKNYTLNIKKLPSYEIFRTQFI